MVVGPYVAADMDFLLISVALWLGKRWTSRRMDHDLRDLGR